MKHYEHVLRKPADLIEYENNARTHDNGQLIQIARSIKEFGFTNPLLIDSNNNIIAGHGRLAAAVSIELDTVPCIVIDNLSKAQQQALVLADNQLALNAGWDMDVLRYELEELQDLDFNIDLIGFDDDFLDELIVEEPEEGLTDEDAVPEPPETPVSVLGDIWQLGDHRLMCGSSTDSGDVGLLMNGCYPKLIHTDPPYGMNAVSKSAVLTKNYGTDILGDDDPQVAKDAFKLIYSLYPEAKQIWWGANYYCSALPDSECWLVWDKNNGGSDQTDCELAWANFRSVVRQFTQASEKTNRIHPTQKPVSLVEWILKRFKFNSETIADFFGGSGSTLIAAEKHNSTAYIMEYDAKFVDGILLRWQDFTGKEAVHIESGKTYEQLKAERDGAL